MTEPEKPGRMGPQRNVARDRAIVREYMSGRSLAAVGEKYGLSQSRTHEIVKAWREAFPPEAKEELVVRDSAWLDEKRAEAAELWDMAPVPAYSNGRPIEMPDGSPAWDHSGRIAGLKLALDIQARLSKMLGLDAAARSDVSVTVTDESVVERIRAERAARLAADETTRDET